MFMVISYDIQKNRVRTKVADLLVESGFFRVQKSVFEGDRPEKTVKQMREQLKKLIGKKDQIRYYRLCDRCIGSIEIEGCPE